MLNVPSEIRSNFDKILKKESVPIKYHSHYHKWLRYYLDFCCKYHHPENNEASKLLFVEKLREKNQPVAFQEQAGDAISLYYQIINHRMKPEAVVRDNTISEKIDRPAHDNRKTAPQPAQSFGSTGIPDKPVYDSHKTAPQNVPRNEWRSAYKNLCDEIQVRHYSRSTLKSYSQWLIKFENFTGRKSLKNLSDTDIKNFMKFLAIEEKVAASTQNQAFNAILFFYRNVLEKEPGDLRKTVRAKRKPYIPVVLSRREIYAIIQQLEYPYDLLVKLLYGCGIRLFECLELRIHNFNFDAGVLTIHDGKGKKDRTVPLPRVTLPGLREHLDSVIALHEEDSAKGYDGTFMIGQLEKKYKNCARDLIWQWFFPAKRLTRVPETGELRRYHLHERHVQRAIRAAVGKTKILKRVSSHTFRHSFATHLLENNYDIRTIQELLGHSDVRTTMIYTHTARSRTIKEAESPLDF